jgi:hypothetical protein
LVTRSTSYLIIFSFDSSISFFLWNICLILIHTQRACRQVDPVFRFIPHYTHPSIIIHHPSCSLAGSPLQQPLSC